MSLSGGQLAGGNSTTEKADNDFYATDPKSVETFLSKAIKDGVFNLQFSSIWECSCGNGSLFEVVKKYFPLCSYKATDLINRGYGLGGIDFLECNQMADLIIRTA